MPKIKTPFMAFITLMCLCAGQLFAQNNFYKTGDTLSDGLVITCVKQTDAYTWLGTDKGLIRVSKVNGKKKNYFSVDGRNMACKVTSMCQRKNGHLWIGTGNGILVYDGFYVYGIHMENTDIPENNITSIAEDFSETIWLGTAKHGLIKKLSTHYKIYNNYNSNLPCNQITELVKDDAGGLFVITSTKNNISTDAIKLTK